MHRSINIQNPKQLYWYKRKILTYIDYENNCFNNKEGYFTVKVQQEYDKITNKIIDVSDEVWM